MMGDEAVLGMASASSVMVSAVVAAHGGWEDYLGYVKRHGSSSVKQVVTCSGVLVDVARVDCPHYRNDHCHGHR